MAAAYLLVVRPWQLRWGATTEEANASMPGDEIVDRPQLRATRAIDIAAPPDMVWPWLVQMGYGRAGWYSHDWLDNGGEPSAERIIDELQHLDVGDVLPTDRDGSGFVVEHIEVPRSLVMVVRRPDSIISVTLQLNTPSEEHTRLVMRLRLRADRTVRGLSFLALMDAGDFVMMRAMMRGIRRRAETAHEQSLEQMDLADLPQT